MTPRRFPSVSVGVSLAALAPCACQKEPGTGHVVEAGPVTRPPGPVSAADAARYVLALVNHDRAEAGLPAVEWDDTAAKGGAVHAADMALHGYTAHWGTDGTVPEERYTDAGGTDFVEENAACFFDGVTRPLDPSASFDPVELEKIEAAFMAEVPPNDGHKKNILGKAHRLLGVGVAQPLGIGQPCMAQEFVDDYGDYDDLPRRSKVGGSVRVRGTIAEPAKFGAVGIARIDPARPMSAEELNHTHTYPIPAPYVLFTPKGFVTPKPVDVNGNQFSIEIPLSDGGKPGRYEISVWATLPGDKSLVTVSQRVVDVR
ncbi:MAG TPA: CAP domain-containing protein [Polyangiaceae bacterium]|nr:CAP domain-containing protein [Polyangiaceae bacterium]